MGPQRMRSNMPFLPRARMPRPVLRRFQRSSGEGESMQGGVVERSWLRTGKRCSRVSANSVYFAASLAEKRAMPPAVLAGLFLERRALASGGGGKKGGVG